jgi:hypothetical protein
MDNQQQRKSNRTTELADMQQSQLNEQFKEWSEAKAKGHTHSDYETGMVERARDKRLLSRSIVWGRDLERVTNVLMGKDNEDIIRASSGDNQPPSSPKATVIQPICHRAKGSTSASPNSTRQRRL